MIRKPDVRLWLEDKNIKDPGIKTEFAIIKVDSYSEYLDIRHYHFWKTKNGRLENIAAYTDQNLACFLCNKKPSKVQKFQINLSPKLSHKLVVLGEYSDRNRTFFINNRHVISINNPWGNNIEYHTTYGMVYKYDPVQDIFYSKAIRKKKDSRILKKTGLLHKDLKICQKMLRKYGVDEQILGKQII